MEVAQISIFLENRSGGLADVIDVLARHEIDIRAVALADMADFGILRLIVDDPDRTRAVLKEAGLVQADRTGTTVTYRLNQTVLQEALMALFDAFGFDPMEPKA